MVNIAITRIMMGVVVDRMTMSWGLKSSRNKESSSRGPPTVKDSGIMVGK